MFDRLLAIALLLFLVVAGGGCAMCDPNYPYGPTAGPHGGYHGRVGSVLEPMPYGAMPHVTHGQPMEAEAMDAQVLDADSMAIE